jgi:ureidoglycolate hydrolase
MTTIISPNVQNFKSFGKIIEYPNYTQKGQTRNLWRIIHRESAKVGWRIAYLILRDKSIGQFGMHPTSDETFEPIKGQALLFVSKDKDLKNVKCFKLDRPIIVKKGVWHNVLTLSQETHIKIFENAQVTQKIWKLKFRFKSFEELQERIKEDA